MTERTEAELELLRALRDAAEKLELTASWLKREAMFGGVREGLEHDAKQARRIIAKYDR